MRLKHWTLRLLPVVAIGIVLLQCSRNDEVQNALDMHHDAIRMLYDNSVDSATLIFTTLTDRYDDTSDPKLAAIAADAHLGAGVLAARNVDFQTAYSEWQAGLQICDKFSLERIRMFLLADLAWIHLYIGDTPGASDLWRQALNGAMRLDIPDVFNEAALGLFTYGGADSPRLYATDLRKWHNYKLPDDYAMTPALNTYRNALDDISAHRVDSALRKLYAMEVLIPDSFPDAARYRAMARQNRMQLLDAENRLGEAALQADSLSAMVDRESLTDMRPWVALAAARIHTRNGDMDRVQENWSRMFSLPDSSLMRNDNRERLRQMSASFNAHNASLQAMKATRKNHTLRNSLIIVCAVLLMICIFLWLQHRKNKKLDQANKALYLRYEELRRSRDDANRMRQEIDAARRANEPPAEQQPGDQGVLNKDGMAELYNRVLDFMESSQEIYNPDFGLSQLADALKTNVRYLSQTVNEMAGKNFPTFLGEFRVREACRQLSNPDTPGRLTIEAIANNVGFKSRSAFSVVFKRITGLSPSDYIRIANEQNA